MSEKKPDVPYTGAEIVSVLYGTGRNAIRNFIEYVSEQVYCAGWSRGIEYDIWLMVTGHKPITYPKHIEFNQMHWLALANIVNGWWTWDDDQKTHIWLTMGDWLLRVQERHGIDPVRVYYPLEPAPVKTPCERPERAGSEQ